MWCEQTAVSAFDSLINRHSHPKTHERNHHRHLSAWTCYTILIPDLYACFPPVDTPAGEVALEREPDSFLYLLAGHSSVDPIFTSSTHVNIQHPLAVKGSRRTEPLIWKRRKKKKHYPSQNQKCP